MIRERKKLKSFIAVIMAACTIVLSSQNFAFASNSKVVITKPNNPVTVDGGEIVGTSSKDKQITIYKSIPFAAAPIGDLRWKAPQPVEPWNGILACTEYSNYAYQQPAAPLGPYTAEFRPDLDTVPSEDCLYLNVWTKRVAAEKRPVIVYIHGGGNTSGSSGMFAYEGENVARKDVVFVSINYRLGIFGFMAHPELSAESEDRVSGNYGILDQIAALNWVKNNIEKFGGDPDNVTVAGQSAGSANVQALMLSPMAKGLFKNAVTMSANSILDKMQTLPEKEALTAIQFKGKTIEDLRAMPAQELIKIGYRSNTVLDGKVFTSSMLDAYKEGDLNDVNLMTGMVIQDGTMFTLVPRVGNGPSYLAMTSISQQDYIESVRKGLGDLADKCLELYPAKSFNCIDQWNEVNQDAMMALQNFVGKARTVKSTKPTYIYKFTKLMPGPNAAEFGVFHTSDVPYWFNNFSPVKADYWANIDYKIGDKMSSYLVNFAKTGNPNGDNLEKWNPYNSSEISYMKIGDPFSTVKLSEAKYKFWEEYFKTLGL
jgi:para-nitrobenzyl esterase